MWIYKHELSLCLLFYTGSSCVFSTFKSGLNTTYVVVKYFGNETYTLDMCLKRT
jgi:hypothetical protein